MIAKEKNDGKQRKHTYNDCQFQHTDQEGTKYVREYVDEKGNMALVSETILLGWCTHLFGSAKTSSNQSTQANAFHKGDTRYSMEKNNTATKHQFDSL